MNEKTQNQASTSVQLPQYRSNTHCPTDDRFVCGGNFYRKVGETATRYLYEVVSVGGTPYYEVFEKGHVYRAAGKGFDSTVLADGQEYYPNDQDFGSWAWCFNSKDMAVRSLRWDRREYRRVPLDECRFADGFEPTI